MKVSELISLLQRCPQGLPVNVAWDSFVCIEEIKKTNVIIVETENEKACGNGYGVGVYLCAMPVDELNHHLEPGHDYHVQGRRVGEPA